VNRNKLIIYAKPQVNIKGLFTEVSDRYWILTVVNTRKTVFSLQIEKQVFPKLWYLALKLPAVTSRRKQHSIRLNIKV